MLKRKMTDKLVEWKKDSHKKPLLIKGARQVGKTFIIEHFAKEFYEHYIYINFEQTPSYAKIFAGDLDPRTIYTNLSLYVSQSVLVPGKTLIFLDEIQSCPQAITALKFLGLDQQYDIIASGSLLGVAYKLVSSWPVGSIETIEMHSMDFEEFLWAIHTDNAAIELVRGSLEKYKKIPEAIHDYMNERFKEYIVVGGMPEVVKRFRMNKDFQEAIKLQKEIVRNYQDDIAKYSNDIEKNRARACFDSIPRQLSKENKKFQYSVVEKGSSARKYEGGLQWLIDAGIIQYCYNLSTLEEPLVAYKKEDIFKIYMKDTGLLVSMLDDGTATKIIEGNLEIYKGAIYENIVGEMLAKSGFPLYYYDKNNRLEIDFIIHVQKQIAAVEVKSSMNTKSKSLKTILDENSKLKGIKLSMKNISVSKRVIHLPLYTTGFIYLITP